MSKSNFAMYIKREISAQSYMDQYFLSVLWVLSFDAWHEVKLCRVALEITKHFQAYKSYLRSFANLKLMGSYRDIWGNFIRSSLLNTSFTVCCQNQDISTDAPFIWPCSAAHIAFMRRAKFIPALTWLPLCNWWFWHLKNSLFV